MHTVFDRDDKSQVFLVLCACQPKEALPGLCVTSVDHCRTDGLVEEGAIVLTSKEWKEMTHDK